MGFQSTVNVLLNLGVVGDIIVDEPHRIQPVTLGAGGGTVGYAFTKSATTGIGTVGGTIAAATPFAGIAVLPKQMPQFGSSATDPLAPSLTLQPNATVAMLTFGSCIVSLPGAFNVGDQVEYNLTTGALKNIANGGTVDTGYALVPDCLVYGVPGAGVAIMSGSSAAGLAVIRLTTPV